MTIIYISIFAELYNRTVGLVNSNIINGLEIYMNQDSKFMKREPEQINANIERKKKKPKGYDEQFETKSIRSKEKLKPLHEIYIYLILELKEQN